MIEFHDNGYMNGFLERKSGGRYEGKLSIEGIDLSPIEGVYFQDGGKQYLWIKRKPLIEYDYESQTYKKRPREPRWETYLEKQVENNSVAYKGEFHLLHFRFSIVGTWDMVLGKDKQRLNLYVERMPMKEQTIIKNISERNAKR